MFRQLQPAMRELWHDVGFLVMAAVWTVAVVLALLLARHESTIGLVALVAAVPFLAVAPWRGRWREFLLLALSVPAFLLVAEVAVRVRFFGVNALLHPTRYQPIGAMSNPDYLVAAPDPRSVYTLRPGYQGWVKGVFVTANSLGVRGREPALAPPIGVCRIITLGSSLTMGEGVQVDAAFPAGTEHLLRKRGFNVEVINFGVGGYSLAMGQALLESVALRYRPCIVVQELSVTALSETEAWSHDLQQSFETTRTVPPPSSIFERNSLALSAIYPPVSLRQQLDRLLSLRPASAQAGDGHFVAHAVDHFGALARQTGFRGVVFVPRPIHSFGIEDFQRAQRQQIRSLADAAGLAYVDSYDRFGAADEAEGLIILPGDLHPNAEGHRRHASALSDGLAAVLKTLPPQRSSVSH